MPETYLEKNFQHLSTRWHVWITILFIANKFFWMRLCENPALIHLYYLTFKHHVNEN